jgi:hypothetical protein
MKKKISTLSYGMIIFSVIWIIVVSFTVITPVSADNCLDDITNLADCMRTPIIREVITISAGLLGVTPLVLVNFLSGLGAMNPIPEIFSNITTSASFQNIISDIWDNIKPIINQINPDLVKNIEKSIMRTAGENLAEKSADIIDMLNQASGGSSASGGKTPPKPPAPVKSTGGTGGAGGTSGSGGTGGPSPSGGPTPTGAVQYTGPVGDTNIEIFDQQDAHQILQQLGLIDPSVPPDGSMPVTRFDLDNLLGQHPSNNPIKITLHNGKTVIINSVQGIAFDSPGKNPGGDPGILDFSKGVAIAAEVVEPAPPTPAPAVKPAGGPSGGSAGPGGGKGTGGTPGGSGGSGSASGSGGGKPGKLLGQKSDAVQGPGGQSGPSGQGADSGSGGSGGPSAEGNVVDKDVSSPTDDF